MKKGEWKQEAKILQGILGTNVRALRIKGEMSQDKLAEKSGLSVNEIGKIESKQANPCLEVLAALAKGFGIPPERLLDPRLDPAPCVVIPRRTGAGKDSDGAVLFTGNGTTVHRPVGITGRIPLPCEPPGSRKDIHPLNPAFMLPVSAPAMPPEDNGRKEIVRLPGQC